jgi:hypothetical protein
MRLDRPMLSPYAFSERFEVYPLGRDGHLDPRNPVWIGLHSLSESIYFANDMAMVLAFRFIHTNTFGELATAKRAHGQNRQIHTARSVLPKRSVATILSEGVYAQAFYVLYRYSSFVELYMPTEV